MNFSYIEPLFAGFVILGLIGVTRLKPGRGKRLALIGMWGVFLVSWPPVDWLLSLPLEVWYEPRPVPLEPRPQAIVVLSSGASPPLNERPYPLLDDETFGRCEHAASLFRQWPGTPVLTSGGGNEKLLLAAVMKDYVRRAGVPEELIWIERRSGSTQGSAYHCAALLRERSISRVALVVEAQSMPRAAACFRKQGIEVIPAPSRFRRLGKPWDAEILPRWKSIRRNETMLHEVLGLVYYKLQGSI